MANGGKAKKKKVEKVSKEIGHAIVVTMKKSSGESML